MSAKEWALDTADMGKIIKGHLPYGAATRAGRHSLTGADESSSESVSRIGRSCLCRGTA